MFIIVLITALSLLASPVAARPPVYLPATEGSYLAVNYLDIGTSDLANLTGSLGGDRSAVEARYHHDDTPWQLALGHEYNALNIDLAGSPATTNGDLHTLHLAGTWSMPVGAETLSLTLAPAVSTSSNAMKEPGEWGSDSLQLWGAAIWRPQGEHWDYWVLGIANDHRFGESRLYPVIGISHKFEHLSLWAAYPDLLLRWDISEQWLLDISLSPDGNEWLAYDRELETADEFSREAWHSEIRVSYQARTGLRLGLSGGYQFDQEWRMRLQDGARLRTKGGDNAYLGVHLGWYWP